MFSYITAIHITDDGRLLATFIYYSANSWKAYFYIHSEYSVKKVDDGTKTQILTSFDIGEIEGFIKKRTKEEIVFCRKGLNTEIKEIHMSKNQLVVFDIKELGFSKKYFPRILKKLSKCDINAKSTDMITNHSDVYRRYSKKTPSDAL